jgi:hypothetical protein
MMHVFFKFGGRDDAYISSRENQYQMLHIYVTSSIIMLLGLWVVWYVYFGLFGSILFAIRIWKIHISILHITILKFGVQNELFTHLNFKI